MKQLANQAPNEFEWSLQRLLQGHLSDVYSAANQTLLHHNLEDTERTQITLQVVMNALVSVMSSHGFTATQLDIAWDSARQPSAPPTTPKSDVE